VAKSYTVAEIFPQLESRLSRWEAMKSKATTAAMVAAARNLMGTSTRKMSTLDSGVGQTTWGHTLGLRRKSCSRAVSIAVASPAFVAAKKSDKSNAMTKAPPTAVAPHLKCRALSFRTFPPRLVFNWMEYYALASHMARVGSGDPDGLAGIVAAVPALLKDGPAAHRAAAASGGL
jgi:hypothetical protein